MAIPDRIIRRVFEITAMMGCLAPLISHDESCPRNRLANVSSNTPSSGMIELPDPMAVSPIVCRNPVHDVGLVMGGTPIRADFIVENVTDQPVWIHILESCVCTRPNTIRCIEPFDSTVVQVSVETRHILGQFTKTVQIRPIPQPPNAMEILAKAPIRTSGAN